MEEKKLSEQESLELISQMIRSTRKNMEVCVFSFPDSRLLPRRV